MSYKLYVTHAIYATPMASDLPRLSPNPLLPIAKPQAHLIMPLLDTRQSLLTHPRATPNLTRVLIAHADLQLTLSWRTLHLPLRSLPIIILRTKSQTKSKPLQLPFQTSMRTRPSTPMPLKMSSWSPTRLEEMMTMIAATAVVAAPEPRSQNHHPHHHLPAYAELPTIAFNCPRAPPSHANVYAAFATAALV